MEAASVIKSFDKIEDGQASLLAGFEAAAIDEFQFESAPEGRPGEDAWRLTTLIHGPEGYTAREEALRGSDRLAQLFHPSPPHP